MSDGEAVVVVEGVSKTYRMRKSSNSLVRRLLPSFRREEVQVEALAPTDLTINAGEFVALIGPSGCGKTTLLRIIDGLVRPDAGRVMIRGSEVTGPRPDCGFVFQDFGLYPWRTVVGNVEFGLELRGVPRRERLERVRRYIDLVGLKGFEDSYPYQLSGGMQQRVGMARMLAVEPEILLLDEPFGALDALTRRVMQFELLKILDTRVNTTAVFVTHDFEEALLLADRVVVMSARPGRIREIVSVPFGRPRDENVIDDRRFIALRNQLWTELRREADVAA